MNSNNPKFADGARTVALIMGFAFLIGATINWLPITYHMFQREFAAGLEAQGRTWGLFFVGGMIISAFGGRLTDYLGLNRAVGFSLMVLGGGMSLIGGAPVFWVLLVSCVFFGIASNWMTIVYSTLISSYFESRRQRLFTWASVSINLGGSSRLPSWGFGSNMLTTLGAGEQRITA